jgi:excisionase family DNA binding protein
MRLRTRSHPPAPAALGVGEVAALLGVHRSSVYRALRAGELRSVRFGGRVLVPVAEVERLLGERLPDAGGTDAA